MLDAITQYILTIVPSVTAIVGMIVFIGVGVGRVKSANKGTQSDVKKLTKQIESLESKLEDVTSENVILKRENRKILSKLEHVHFIDEHKEE